MKLNNIKFDVIDINDKIDFQCQQCGECCRNRDDIILDNYNVYNISKNLSITTEEFIDKYCITNIGPNSGIPIICLKPVENGKCSFLDYDTSSHLYKCRINDFKPDACRNHPIGVMTKLERGELDNIDFDNLDNIKSEYIKVEQCDYSSGHNNYINVKDFVCTDSDYLRDKKIGYISNLMVTKFLDLREVYFIISKFVMKLIEKKGIKTARQCTNFIMDLVDKMFYYMYINYDISKPFDVQTIDNIKTLEKHFIEFNNIYKIIYNSIVEQSNFNKENINVDCYQCFDALCTAKALLDKVDILDKTDD